MAKKKMEDSLEEEIDKPKKTSKKGEKKKSSPKKKTSQEETVPTVDEVLKELKTKGKTKKYEESPEDNEQEDFEEEDEIEEEDLEEEEDKPKKEKKPKKPAWTTKDKSTKNLMMMANATPFGSLLAYMSLESKDGVDKEMVRYQIAQNIIVSLFTFWWFPIYVIIALIAIYQCNKGTCWEMPIVSPWAHYWVDKEKAVPEEE